jgi:hypothetical protein
LLIIVTTVNIERHEGRILIINCWRRSINAKY